MLKLSSCDYSDVYILVSGTIAITNAGTAASTNNRKNMIIKNCVAFTSCISKINNSQTNNAKDIDVVMEMYNLIKYSDTYWKISGNLGHYYRDDLYVDAN